MQQRFRRLAMFFGMSAVAAGGLAVVACGSDGDAIVATPQTDRAKTDPGASKSDGGVTNDDNGGGTNGDGDGDGGDTSAADCGKAPRLRPTPNGGFNCPFQAKGAGANDAGAGNCSTGQTCCSPAFADGGPFDKKFPPSFCANGTDGTACETQASANNSEFKPGFFSGAWQCQDKSNCAAGEVCVLFTSAFAEAGKKANIGPTNDKTIPAACKALKSFQAGGTKCLAPGKLTDGDVKLCSANDACEAPATCEAFNASNRTLGACRQP